MLRFVLLALLVGTCLADDLNLKNQWGKFKSTFKKQFQNKQVEMLKQARWESSVKSILKHNIDADMGVHTYKKAVNEFTDFTKEEMEQKLFGAILPEVYPLDNFEPKGSGLKAESAAPDNWDWRDKGVVTKAKSQGSCGSCWAFAVAATVESALAIKTGKAPVDLSPQHLVDCSGSYGTKGCGGAWPGFAFQYVRDNGISSWNCYPYEKSQKTCRYDTACNQTMISGYFTAPHNEIEMKETVYQKGPLLVLINANDNLSKYSSGIFNDPCKGNVNHAVTLVGYGTEDGKDFWIIKNSWGDYWGEKGSFRMARNSKNMCQVATYGSYPAI